MEYTATEASVAFSGKVDSTEVLPAYSPETPKEFIDPSILGHKVAWVTITASYRGDLASGTVVPVRYGTQLADGARPIHTYNVEPQTGNEYLFLAGIDLEAAAANGTESFYFTLEYNGVGVLTTEPDDHRLEPSQLWLDNLLEMVVTRSPADPAR